MTDTWVRSSVRRAARAGLAAVILAFVTAIPAEADSHRARLSRDLADRVAAGTDAPASVIVSGTDAEIRALAARYGARIKKAVRGGAVLDVTGGQLVAISQDPDVPHLAGDVPVYRMSVTEEATGADQVWSGLDGLRGFTGRGVGVAVIDSGIAPHKALRNRVVASVDFTRPNGRGYDGFGHGTHVAGIIAGTDSDYAGLAPGAHIVSLKVLGADGSGETSDVINAIDWAIEHSGRYRLRVINLSLGHPVLESWRDDPLCQAVQRAVDAGLVVVAAAGNLGKTDDGRPVVGGIVSPGNSPAALTVGALNTRNTPYRSDDVMATYSSRGPTAIDYVLKPELAAPGNKIEAASAAGSYLARTYPESVVGHGTGGYITLSGTSMSSAVVAGAVALLLEANPALRPWETKLALQLTSSRVDGAGLIESGAGSLNIAAAVALVGGEATELPHTVISDETIVPGGLAYGTLRDPQGLPDTLLVSGKILVWGANTVTADILVWGATTVTADILVWGANTVTADILVWGANTVTADILVWGANIVTADILVWGAQLSNSDTLVWGHDQFTPNPDVTPNILVWGASTVVRPN